MLSSSRERIEPGEGAKLQILRHRRPYPFRDNHIYWAVTKRSATDLGTGDVAVNRAQSYLDHCDFPIRCSDSRKRRDESRLQSLARLTRGTTRFLSSTLYASA